MTAAKEANTPKHAVSESGTDLQETIEKFKPPDPSVITRKEKRSGLIEKHD